MRGSNLISGVMIKNKIIIISTLFLIGCLTSSIDTFLEPTFYSANSKDSYTISCFYLESTFAPPKLYSVKIAKKENYKEYILKLHAGPKSSTILNKKLNHLTYSFNEKSMNFSVKLPNFNSKTDKLFLKIGKDRKEIPFKKINS